MPYYDSFAITTVADRIHVTAPYNPAFPELARRLGGKWHATGKTWSFDSRDREAVERLCNQVYGDPAAPLVTIRITLTHTASHSYWIGPRQVAVRMGRDSHVKLGDGCVVIEGKFPSRGGSVKYPALAVREPIVIEVRDLRQNVVDAIIANNSDIQIV